MTEPARTPIASSRQSRTEIVDGTWLEPVVQRPSLGSYVARLWQRRHFILADSRARVLSGARGTALGQAWLVLRPVLDAGVYLVIFGLLLQGNRGIENFLGYLVIGTFMFSFTSRCVSVGAQSLIGGKALIKSFTFPRAALPAATVVRETLSYVPVLLTMLLLVLVIPPGAVVTWRWILVPVIVALQVLLCLGLALIVARITARVLDFQHVIGFLTRFWLYGSAVFFSYERFIDHPAVLELMRINPMFVVLDMTRDCVLYAATPSLSSWLLLVAWSFGLAAAGLVFFWRGEDRYGAL